MLLSLTHVPRGGGYDNGQKTPVEKPTGHFSLWQLTSASDTIGNSYVLKTAAGHLILIDGGMETNGDAAKLRSYIKAQGNNKVDAWWFSHPHGDHIGAFLNIADDLQGITIDTIYYSRLADSIKEGRALTDRFNKKLDEMSAAGVNVVNLTLGARYDMDGIFIKVLGIANPEKRIDQYPHEFSGGMLQRALIAMMAGWHQVHNQVFEVSQLRLHADGSSRPARCA